MTPDPRHVNCPPWAPAALLLSVQRDGGESTRYLIGTRRPVELRDAILAVKPSGVVWRGEDRR
jgi:hypothetical protein